MKRLKHLTGQFRTAVFALVVVLLLLLCTFMVMGCSGDDDADALPPLTAILAEAVTDHRGHIRSLRDDNGRLWIITNADTTAVSPYTPDSLYRVRAWVIPENATGTDGALRLRAGQLDWLFSYMPRRVADADVRHDPVERVSATITPRYVNMRLAVRCARMAAHRFGFIDGGIVTAADGLKTLTLTLCHDSGGDAASYTMEDVFCCPIYQYANVLTPGRDKVRLIVHTVRGPLTHEWTVPETAP